MSDLIDRQTAIDAILAVTGNSSVRELYEHVQEHELSDMWSGGVNAAIDIIIAVPSAQLEERTEERTETHACDLISRRAALDAMCELMHHWFGGDSKDEIREIKRELENLPSAQPEIIHCKECKHWLDIDDGRQKHRMCADIYGDWFCADAERRIDE